ncbi:MAG: hypothetical protein J6Y62_00515 [Clostridia bacterium]|nr:hypothetical protein [Clostridia bacterium]
MDIQHAITLIGRKMGDEYPFYSGIFKQLPKTLTTKVETMGLEYKDGDVLLRFLINPEYIEKTIRKFGWEKARTHFVELFQHQVLHVIFKHSFLKEPASLKKELAKELSVNSYIDRDKLLEGDKGIFPEDLGFENELGYKKYYEMLPDLLGDRFEISFVPYEGKDGESKENSGKVGRLELKDKKTGKVLASMDVHGGDVKKGSGNGQGNGSSEGEGTSLAEAKMDSIIQSAANECKRKNCWGSTPAGLRQELDLMFKKEEPMINWKAALREFCSNNSDTVLDVTNKRLSKRFGNRPGNRLVERLNIAIGIDTSGSISSENLMEFFNELSAIEKTSASMTVFECDCQIGRVYPYRQFNSNTLKKVSGGGGTDLEPVIARAKEEKFDAVIYFTDGEAPVINTNYNIPVVLVIENSYDYITKERLAYPYAQRVFYVENGKIKVH